MTLLQGWRLAVGALTVLPSGPVAPSPSAARAMVGLAPLAVLPLAVGAGSLAAIGSALDAPELVLGLLIAGWLALLTRAMHLDAVADVADGLGAGWDPQRARDILTRGDVGPMGATALILVLGLQGAAFGAIAHAPRGWLVIACAVAASRWWLAPACTGLPAMPGSRLGEVYAGSLPTWQAVLWPILGTALLIGAAVAAGTSWLWGAAAGVLATGAVLILRARARRTFEGMNGDVLGACIEVALTIMVVVLACR